MNMTNIPLYSVLKQKVQSIVNYLGLEKPIMERMRKGGRPLALQLVDILSLGLYKQMAQITTKKAVYEQLRPECCYKTMVGLINRFAIQALQILQVIMRHNRMFQDIIKHIDSTAIPVCLNKNGKYHKTMAEYAEWSKTGSGSFYGLKLHIITDRQDKLLNFGLTSGNTDDRKMVMPLTEEMWGYLIGDAGYVSEPLRKEYYQEGKRLFMCKPKKNMKKIASDFDIWLYNTRWQIEFNFRNLKMFYGLVTSLPRSVVGYLANYIYSILAYTLRQAFPQITLA